MHCVCCPIALVSLERNSGERKRDAGEKKREKKCVSRAHRGGGRGSERVQRGNTRANCIERERDMERTREKSRTKKEIPAIQREKGGESETA